MGRARPSSVWPRARSTLGRVKRVKMDSLDEGARSRVVAVGERGAAGREGSACKAASRRLVAERVKRQREAGGASWATVDMAAAAAAAWGDRHRAGGRGWFIPGGGWGWEDAACGTAGRSPVWNERA